MRFILAALSVFLFISAAHADGTIDTLSAASALAGTEAVPIFQTANPAVKTTTQGIANLIAPAHGGNISAGSIFGTSGYNFIQPTGTDTDTVSSGTIALSYINVFGARTLASSSATTLTTAASAYFNAPAQGTNVTLTNSFPAIFNQGSTFAPVLGLSVPGNSTGYRSWAFYSGAGNILKFQRWTDNFAAANATAWQVDTSVGSAMTFVVGATNMSFPGIASDSTHTDTTVCQDTTSHGFYAGSGTAGVCLGNVSSIRFKRDWQEIDDGISTLNGLEPGTYRYKPGIADGGAKLQYGFKAEDYAKVLPVLTRFDSEGKPNGVDMVGLIPVLVSAVKQQQAEIQNLRQRVEELSK